nr:serine/threonine-protein kinase mTOR-like [Cherax quadricarinatus]
MSMSFDSRDTPSKKRVVEPAVFVCVSLVARGVEGAVRSDVKELLEPMMATGLSPPLTLALQELAREIPTLKGSVSYCHCSPHHLHLPSAFGENKPHFITKLQQTLDILTQLIPNKYILSNYLSGKTMSYLLGCLRGRDKERPTAFVTLGLLAVAVGSSIKKYLPKIMEVIKASLPTKQRPTIKLACELCLRASSEWFTPSKKRVVEPAVFVCVSLVARGVEGAVRSDVKELLEPMMATGLSPPLTLALQELAREIPTLKRDIAEGLLRMLSQILMNRSLPHRSGAPPPPPSPDHQDTASIVLALRTLGSFDFEGTGQSLMQFIRHVADQYLSSEHREVRLEGVQTCCHLLRPTFATLGRRMSQTQTHIIFNIVSKVLWVCVTDMGKWIFLYTHFFYCESN